ncbi:hypothetical protein G6F23_006997 [Rhizopus arrhizus]|nr:hypothetical protein G6F23_006997 [Rhizopus arrhizus]
MGLLNFKKSSRKQGSKSSPSHPKKSNHVSSTPLLQQFDYPSPAISRPSESSLMDDIMKELNTEPSSPVQPSHPPSPVKHSSMSRKPAVPLLQFNPTSSTTLPHDNLSEPRTPSPRLLVSVSSHQLLHSSDDSESDTEESQTSNQRHSMPVMNKQLMNRMKERHRLEVRKTMSPLTQEGLSPSPSMPTLFSEKPRTLVQSQSFTSAYNITPQRRPQSQLVRSASTMANIMQIQTQPEVGLLKRHAPLVTSPSYIRNSFSQLPIRPLPSTVEEEEVGESNVKYQINRSVSAYSGFPGQNQQELKRLQEEFKCQQELQEIKRQQELQLQQEVQRQQQQIIVQQQQQLQQLQHQQQLLIQQQQYQQQQQQQQLLLQQQQIQKLHQSSLEMVKVVASQSKTAQGGRPLYERSSHAGTHSRRKKHPHGSECHGGDHTCSGSSHHEKRVVMPHVVSSLPLTPELIKQQHQRQQDDMDDELPLSPTTIKLSSRSARSSTSTLILKEDEEEEKKEEKKMKLPMKLKRELENMQLGRSVYSVPDLSVLLRESEDDDCSWDSIEIPKRTKKVAEPIMKEATIATTPLPSLYLYYLNDCHPRSIHVSDRLQGTHL